MSTLSMTDTKQDWLVWLEAVAAAAESKEQLHSLVDDAIGEFIKEADAGQRTRFAAALRERAFYRRRRLSSRSKPVGGLACSGRIGSREA